MNGLIVNFLAVGLTLSQVLTKPADQIRTHFDPAKDQAVVRSIFNDGCQYISKNLMQSPNPEENIDMDQLRLMFMKPDGTPLKEVPKDATHADGTGLKLDKNSVDVILANAPRLFDIYDLFCKGRSRIGDKDIDYVAIINQFNQSLDKLPDVTKILNMKFPEMSRIFSGDGRPFTEFYSGNNRRIYMPISQIPKSVQNAFVAAEDNRFYKHHGVDLLGVFRAFMSLMANEGSGKAQGGSTITQQVIKNLLVGNEISFDRKMKEMVLAAQLESKLSKEKILELYLNFVFLGRASWGVEMASQSYFGKSVRALDLNSCPDKSQCLSQATLLATLVRGAEFYNPDIKRDPTKPNRIKLRRGEILTNMYKDKMLSKDEIKAAYAVDPSLIAYEPPHSRAAFYFLDQIQREANTLANIPSLTSGAYTVQSTINPELQRSVEEELQDGLYDYQIHSDNPSKYAPLDSLDKYMTKPDSVWQDELPKYHPRDFDVHWPLATVIDDGSESNVGLVDGTVLPLDRASRRLNPSVWDIVRVKVNKDKSGDPVSATIRVNPTVQGAVVVLEAKTGRVLAMTGGFSYGLSNFDRVMFARRQPGSSLKPYIYLSAMQHGGLQPNTILLDEPITLGPIYKGQRGNWTPKDFDGSPICEVNVQMNDGRTMCGVTARRAVELSLNRPTAFLMAGMLGTPQEGLATIGDDLVNLGIYDEPIQYYPDILGDIPARLIDMARAYATIANVGLKPQIHFIDRIEQNGKQLYRRDDFEQPQPVKGIDRSTFYQIRHILEGVVERGTAAGYIKSHHMDNFPHFVAGKTGTSNNARDAWFVGFTNDIVVATWVGYDTKHIHATLGKRASAAGIALPIGAKILQKSFTQYLQPQPFTDPPEDVTDLRKVDIDPYRGTQLSFAGTNSYKEYFKTSLNPYDTTYTVVQKASRYLSSYAGQGEGSDDDQDPGTVIDRSFNPRQRPYVPGREDNYGNQPSDMNSLDNLFRNFFGR